MENTNRPSQRRSKTERPESTPSQDLGRQLAGRMVDALAASRAGAGAESGPERLYRERAQDLVKLVRGDTSQSELARRVLERTEIRFDTTRISEWERSVHDVALWRFLVLVQTQGLELRLAPAGSSEEYHGVVQLLQEKLDGMMQALMSARLDHPPAPDAGEGWTLELPGGIRLHGRGQIQVGGEAAPAPRNRSDHRPPSKAI